MNNPAIYLVTVGTGTAGPHSSVADGIVAGIRLAGVATAYLLPSASPASLDVAEYVAAELVGKFAPASIESRFFILSDPDSLERCRREIRDAIRAIKARHPGDVIKLNPTSGTKQMTTAAFMAGIEEGLEGIDYITGERADGVVKTGTERLTTVSGRRILGGQALRDAVSLIHSGAYQGAATVLMPYCDLFPETAALADTLGRWNRFSYREAIRHAVGPDLAPHRRALTRLADSATVSIERAADLLNFVDRCLGFGQVEEALATLYRLAEMLALLRLKELGVDIDHPNCANLEQAISLPKKLFDKFRSMEKHDGELNFGLANALKLLKPTQSPLYHRLYQDRNNWRALQLRHSTRYGHGGDFVPDATVRDLRKTIASAANESWPMFSTLCNELTFPPLDELIAKEAKDA